MNHSSAGLYCGLCAVLSVLFGVGGAVLYGLGFLSNVPAALLFMLLFSAFALFWMLVSARKCPSACSLMGFCEFGRCMAASAVGAFSVSMLSMAAASMPGAVRYILAGFDIFFFVFLVSMLLLFLLRYCSGLVCTGED